MHPLAVGIIVTNAPVWFSVLFIAVKEGIVLPDPLAARPMPGLLLVQENVVPDTGPEMAVAGAVDPLQ